MFEGDFCFGSFSSFQLKYSPLAAFGRNRLFKVPKLSVIE